MEIERGARVVSRAHQENIYEKSFSHNVRFEFELFDPAPPKGLLAFSLFSNIHIAAAIFSVFVLLRAGLKTVNQPERETDKYLIYSQGEIVLWDYRAGKLSSASVFPDYCSNTCSEKLNSYVSFRETKKIISSATKDL